MPEVEIERLERSLERYQGFVVAGLAFLVAFAMSVSGIMLWQAYRLGQQAAAVQNIAVTTHSSLCTLRHDLEVRHDAAVKYLHDHPYGIVSERTGETLISANQLQQSIDAQQVTLDALGRGGLECK